MRSPRAALLLAALLFSLAAGAEPQPGPRPSADTDWALRLAKDGELVAFRGMVDPNAGGIGGGPILYPAPNVVGFLAAVVTHGLMVEGLKAGQRSKLQEEADRVLAPYQGVLGAFTAKELMREGLEQSRAGRNRRAVAATEGAGAEWVVDSVSVFSLTQDRRAIVLETAFAMFAPRALSAPAQQVIVRVVSDPRPEDDPGAYWAGRDGANLKSESARLFAQALDLGVAEAIGGPVPEARHRTVRYTEGGAERMERAQPIAERCERMVLRTLRGAILSVPVAPSPTRAACGESPAQPAR